MCGITGKIYLDNRRVLVKELNLMNRAIAHRGPDDEGIYISKNRKVGLGNTRLAILDLSKRGHMPMEYMNRYVITYNGEIYNYLTEQKKLIKKGYVFKSRSDTEVILALYHEYGIKCINHLRGMFSFVIYDSQEQIIFAAVGKLGKKPLKYFWDGRSMIFASELKAILTQEEVKASPDYIAIHNYFTYGFVSSPRTGFNQIYKLQPAHYIILDLKNKSLVKERYWKADFNRKLDISEGEWVDRILSLLRESVKLRMIADVPVGAFLSGGIDSSMVVALMAQESKRRIKTFTIGFKEPAMNELRYAKKISQMYNTEHNELVVTKESIENLPWLVKQFEEPFFDPSALVTYFVSKLASEKVKVVLNGDGGDENFAGYDRFFRLRRDVFLEQGRNLILAGYPIYSLFGKRIKALARGDRFLNKLNLPLSARYASYNSIFLNNEKNDLYNSYFRDITKGINSVGLMDEFFIESEANDLADRALYADLCLYLPEDLLVKVDIASMSVSLEGRSPFLDYKFVEMAAQIPFSLKIKNGQSKYILKKAAEQLIPKDNIYRS